VCAHAVFAQALEKGWGAYWAAITEPDALSSIAWTLLAAGIAVPLNVVFGLAAAGDLPEFQFRGKNVLITLIDLPFAVSPVIAGPDLRPHRSRSRLVRALAQSTRHQDHFARARHRAGDGFS